ncbi:MAG TPA: SgcJ/EcaC family oxidoreductase [Tepidiformaceae bacterium]|nr:SgcJ/EcaC family oxidoreductase [Tepidiformaceae bacterium]
MTDPGPSIRALHTRLLDAWNRRSAADYAALFADGGAVVGFDGSQMHGPAEIRAQLGDIFASHPTAAYVAKIEDVRLVSPDAAILTAAVGMVPPGGSDINPAVNAIQVLVASHRDGGWLIESFQNTPAAFHGRPELVERMTEELRAVLANQ